jgi:hypothetical protein
MKSSLHSPVPFLPFVLNYSANCQLVRLSDSSSLRSSLYSIGAAPTENTFSYNTSIAVCLPFRCLERVLLLLPAFSSARICLPSCCLAMIYSGYQASRHNILVTFYREATLCTPLDPRNFETRIPRYFVLCMLRAPC